MGVQIDQFRLQWIEHGFFEPTRDVLDDKSGFLGREVLNIVTNVIADHLGIEAQRFVDAVQGRGLTDVERDMAERAKELAGGRPSLLQDVMRGRRTEVQYLNGYVSEQGRQVGIPTPFNDKVVELIMRVPPGTLKPDPKNLDPLVAMLPR